MEAVSLHKAAKRGWEKVVKDIIAQGEVAVDEMDANGFTPFALAANNRHVGVMRALLEAGANPRQDFRMKRLSLAGMQISLRVVKDGVVFLSRPDAERTNAALLAVFSENRDMLDLMLEFGAPADYAFRGTTLLVVAAASHSTEAKDLVRLLLDHGASVDEVDASGGSALHQACHRQDSDVARMLLEAGAAVDVKDAFGETPLSRVCCIGVDLGMAELLLRFDADVNSRNSRMETPLMAVAASHGHDSLATLERLVSRDGADVNARSAQGTSALKQAVSILHPEKVEVLLAAGADIDIRDDLDETVIFNAVRLLLRDTRHDLPKKKAMHVIELLVAGGAHVNCRSRTGLTPLLILAGLDGPRPHSLHGLRLLLESGVAADDAPDENGDTALQYMHWMYRVHRDNSAEGAFREAARMLLEHMADADATSNDGLMSFLRSVIRAEDVEVDTEAMEAPFELQRDRMPGNQ